MSRTPWTEEDKSIAIRLRNEGKSDSQIAVILGRSRSSVSGQFWAIRLGPAGLKAYNSKYNRKRKPQPRVLTSTMVDPEVRTIYRPTPEMLADRARREAMPHRDLTGAFFGDPKLGASELDRRLAAQT